MHTIHLEFITVQTAVDGISQEIPAIRDSIRKVTSVLTAVDALPGIAKNIEGIYGTLPDIADKVTTVHDELPGISGKVAAIHDELLPRMQDTMQNLMVTILSTNDGLAVIDLAPSSISQFREASPKHNLLVVC